MRIYNTLTRKKEEFIPQDKDNVIHADLLSMIISI